MTLPAVFVAGILAVTSPCILPIIPVIFGAALQERKSYPVFMVLGLATSFSLFGALFGAFGAALPIDRGQLQTVAVAAFFVLGITLVSERANALAARIMTPLERVASRLQVGAKARWPWQAFLLGMLVAVLWAPCAGPILGAVLLLASAEGEVLRGAWLLFVFSLGASIPLLAITMFGQRWLQVKGKFAKSRKLFGKIFGIVLICTSLLVLTGSFKKIERLIVPYAPSWSTRY